MHDIVDYAGALEAICFKQHAVTNRKAVGLIFSFCSTGKSGFIKLADFQNRQNLTFYWLGRGCPYQASPDTFGL